MFINVRHAFMQAFLHAPSIYYVIALSLLKSYPSPSKFVLFQLIFGLHFELPSPNF